MDKKISVYQKPMAVPARSYAMEELIKVTLHIGRSALYATKYIDSQIRFS